MSFSILFQKIKYFLVFSFVLFIYFWSEVSFSASDDYGNYFYNATTINENGVVTGVVNSSTDYDSFRIELKKSGILNISLSEGLIGWFYRTKNYDDYQRFNYPSGSFDLEAGVYYLIVSGHQKNYEIGLNFDDLSKGNKYELTFDQSYGGYVNLSEGSCRGLVCTIEGTTKNPSLRLTAKVTDNNYKFSHWIGIPECNTNPVCDITVSKDMNIGVKFIPVISQEYKLTFDQSYGGHVNISKGSCSGFVCTIKGNTHKISLKLTAKVTDNNYKFSHWTGILECNTNPVCDITVSKDMNIGVEFVYIDINPANTDLINGIAVPPEPDKTKNNATIKGVDANSDGIRDDVERLIAKEFGSSSLEIKNLAIAEQELIINPTKENKERYTKLSICNNINSENLLKVTKKLLNTKERILLYKTETAGTTIELGDNLCD